MAAEAPPLRVSWGGTSEFTTSMSGAQWAERNHRTGREEEEQEQEFLSSFILIHRYSSYHRRFESEKKLGLIGRP